MTAGILITATVFSSIALVLGALMVMANNPAGWSFVIIGILAQAGWLAVKAM